MAENEPQPTIEDLQRDKLMLEIRKLEQDILAQNERLAMERSRLDIEMRRDRWFLPLSFIGGGAGLLAAAAAMGKLFFGG